MLQVKIQERVTNPLKNNEKIVRGGGIANSS